MGTSAAFRWGSGCGGAAPALGGVPNRRTVCNPHDPVQDEAGDTHAEAKTKHSNKRDGETIHRASVCVGEGRGGSQGRPSPLPQRPSPDYGVVTCRSIGPSLRPISIATPTSRKGPPIDALSSSLDALPLTLFKARESTARVGVPLNALGWVWLIHARALGKKCATIGST